MLRSVLLLALGWAMLQPETATNFHRPVFLPDGQTLLVMSDRDGGDWELYLASLDGQILRRLTDHAGWDGYADVSPDSQSFVFDRADDHAEGIMLGEFGGGARWLVQEEGVGGARFAPDGASIVFRAEQHGNRNLHRLWLADGRREQLTDAPGNEGDGVFAPDGRRIAYVASADDGRTGVETLDLGTGGVRRIATVDGRGYGVAWSADAATIYFNADTDGDHEIYAVDVATGRVEQLTHNDVTDHLPVVSPDGATLAYTSETAAAEEVHLLDLATGEARKVSIDLPATEKVTAFTNVNIIPMSGAGAVLDGTVLVSGSRIAAVGPRTEVTIPPDAKRIDAGGGYLLPGLVDAHVHLRKANTVRFYLARGFTTVRDMNANTSHTVATRDLVDAGELLGARVVAASPIVLGGPFRDYPAPQTRDEGAAIARRLAASGYDLIKVFRAPREAFAGLRDAAREMGVPLAGHVPDLGLDGAGPDRSIAFDEILQSGMVSLEHIVEVARAGGATPEHRDRLDTVAEKVAASGIAIGTLAAGTGVSNQIKEDRAAFLREHGSRIREVLGDGGIAEVEAMDMTPWTVLPDGFAAAVVHAFHRAGVRLVLGTDSHHPVALAGDAGLRELEFLVTAGLSEYEALRTATVSAAAVIGLEDTVGTIEIGKQADLLLLSADPRTDIGAVRSPVGVMRGGRWLDAHDLELLYRAAILEGAW